MNRIRIGIVFLLLPVLALVDDVTLGVCRDTNGVYQFSYTGPVDSWTIEGALDADGVKFTIYYDGTSQSIYGYPDALPCIEPENIWKPAAPSILIPASDGWFLLEIQDAYGHWSLVTDATHPNGIALQASGGFVELIGSPGQDVDPAHYRLIEVLS